MAFELNQNVLSVKDWNICGSRRYGEDRAQWKFKCPSCGKLHMIGDYSPLTRFLPIQDCIDCGWKGNGTENPIFLCEEDMPALKHNIFDFYDDPLCE